jgi:excisionase family DNA binding protein
MENTSGTELPPKNETQTETEPRSFGELLQLPYLTIQDAARLLQVGEETVERMIINGDIPVVEISGRGKWKRRCIKRIRRESLDEAMRRKERVPYNPPPRRKTLPCSHDYFRD